MSEPRVARILKTGKLRYIKKSEKPYWEASIDKDFNYAQVFIIDYWASGKLQTINNQLVDMYSAYVELLEPVHRYHDPIELPTGTIIKVEAFDGYEALLTVDS